MVGNYFGDKEILPCGICDNCLQAKKTILNKDEFNEIQKEIEAVLLPQPMDIKDLLLKLKGIKKEKAWMVIDFLQSENKLSITADGMIIKQP